MFVLKSIIFFVSTILLLCESGFVDNLPKCNINDGNCEKELIVTILRDISKTGIPELGIPAVDPIHLKDVAVSILNLLNVTLVEGNLKGIKDCKVKKFFTDVEDEHAVMELFCNSLTLKGQYKAFASSPIIKSFLGSDTVQGDGNFKLKIEKLYIKFDYLFYIQKREDDIYIKCKRDKTVYTHNIGNMIFNVDKLYLGTQDASQMVSSLLNANWKLLMTSFGKPFMDKAMEYVYEFVHKFFDAVPCKYYISNDLTQYARP